MAEKKASSGTKKPATKPKTQTASKSKSSAAASKKPAAKQNDTKPVPDRAAARQRTAIILLAAAAFVFFVAVIPGQHVWYALHTGLFGIFGVCAWAIPLILIALAVIFAVNRPLGSMKTEFIFAALFIVILSGIVHVGCHDALYLSRTGFSAQISDAWHSDVIVKNGGVLGVLIGNSIAALFGRTPAMITMILVLLVSLMLFSGTTLLALYHAFTKPVKKVGSIADARIEQGMRRREEREAERAEKRAQQELNAPKPKPANAKKTFNVDIPIEPDDMPTPPRDEDAPAAVTDNFLPDFILPDNAHVEPVQEPVEAPLPEGAVPTQTRRTRKPKSSHAVKDAPSAEEKQPSGSEVEAPPTLDPIEVDPPEAQRSYKKPPLSCLAEPVYNAEYGSANAEIEQNSALLIKTLESFNVKATITGVFRGPSVTRYELLPAEGVKISKITSLADDIALRLAASGVRIEAPIPNKAAIGIEVPNRAKASVTLREIIDTDVYRKGSVKSILNVALGKDIAGNVICADLARMPHLLIAGTTGSGKSVCVNSMIMSLLYNAEPDEVKLLMIDPKQVEFTVYNGIPHLLVPVVSDARKASGALGWAVTEMLGRYKKFTEYNVRDITGYNRLCEKDDTMQRMSRIVIFIDELSDLMMVAQSEVEDAICRLAQMARAAGMHLVIATQRPSVDVITGLIKANIPSRIALSVSSQVDSRTILDTAGAEKLLGYGDMLYNPVGMSKPLRVQGCFVSEREVEEVVSFIRTQSETSYDENVMDEIEKQAVAKKKGADMPAEEKGQGAPVDEKLQKAIEVVVEAGMASTTLLQRKLGLGYARAARLIDELEERKIVGPFEGSKPRKVLITKQQWMEMCALSSDAPVPPADDAPPFDTDEYEEVDPDEFE